MDCPHHCWYAYMEIGGNHKTRIPDVFKQFIADLHAMCSHNKNSIVAWGFSRGARWLEELVREHSAYLDVAVIIAGYPETRDKWTNTSVAKELIAVKSTIVSMVHFVADSCCNASIYPNWYAEFESAMARQDHGTGFLSYVVPGSHDDAGSLFYEWDFTFCPDMVEWFEVMWRQLQRTHL